MSYQSNPVDISGRLVVVSQEATEVILLLGSDRISRILFQAAITDSKGEHGFDEGKVPISGGHC
jgi:hypothetical protein